jgi:hypothetical protein
MRTPKMTTLLTPKPLPDGASIIERWCKMLAQIDDRLIRLELARDRPGITIIHPPGRA